MHFLAQLSKDGHAVPHQPTLAIPVEDLGGGMSLFHLVGGPAREPVDYVQVSHVVVSLDGGLNDAPFSRTLFVKNYAGVVAIRRGSATVVVWRGLNKPVHIDEHLEGVAEPPLTQYLPGPIEGDADLSEGRDRYLECLSQPSSRK